jgi:Family of unknown function (DUF5994)
MTVTLDSTPMTDERAASPSARLFLKSADATPGLLDGAWWPRSRDLSAEIPALTDALDRCWRRITRITVNPAFWSVVPRKVAVTGHVVQVGWFTAEQDPHKLLLLSYTVGRLDLLVVPPTTGATAAARLMSAAADPLNLLTASGLIANEEAACNAAEADRGPEEEWESEGGASSPARGNPAKLPSPAQGM